MIYQIICCLAVKIKDSLPKDLFVQFLLILPNQNKNYLEDICDLLGRQEMETEMVANIFNLYKRATKLIFILKGIF